MYYLLSIVNGSVVSYTAYCEENYELKLDKKGYKTLN